MQTNYSDLQITVYIANLKKRTDRLEHIKQQFEDKPEFDVHIMEAVEHEVGDMGLWLTFRKCVQMAKKAEEDVFIFCEDDHQFTENYSKELLFENIVKTYRLGGNLLIGGSTGGFNLTVPVSESLIWIDHYWSNQFIAVFSSFFDDILDYKDYDNKKKLDNELSTMTLNKYIFCPFISSQAVFGYSDATKYNNDYPEEIPIRFKKSEGRLVMVSQIYKQIKEFNL